MSTLIGTSAEAYAMAVQMDGRIVVGGQAEVSDSAVIAMVRYQPDGSLDSTFGVDGVVSLDIGGASQTISALLIQSDGKIIAGGTDGLNFMAARFLANGALDPGFGTAGMTISDFGALSFLSALAFQPDGKIIGAGELDHLSCVARYSSNGTLDASFGVNGMVSTDIGLWDGAMGVAVEPNGRIVTCGHSSGAYAYARYDVDGGLDPDFGDGSDGMLIVDPPGAAGTPVAIALQPDGKIISAGYSGGDFCAVRLNADGLPDPGFGGSEGTVLVSVGTSNGQVGAMALQPDGRILIGGKALYVNSSYTLLRLNSDGGLDGTFGSDGVVHTDLGEGISKITALCLQPDHRFLATGSHAGGEPTTFTTVRYFMGPMVGVEEVPAVFNSASLFPMPAGDRLTLTLTCEVPVRLSAELLDGHGRSLCPAIRDVHLESGRHNLPVELGKSLAPGLYFLRLHDGMAQRSLRVVKW